MPWYSEYHVRKDFPRRLRYRGATCYLELVRSAQIDSEWVFRVRKVPDQSLCEIASSRLGRYGLETDMQQGLIVEEGTPAAKILDRLVREGFATKHAANPRRSARDYRNR